MTPDEQQEAIEATRKRRKAVSEKRKHVEPKGTTGKGSKGSGSKSGKSDSSESQGG